MAGPRERPYELNLVMYLGTGKIDVPQAGFQEVSGIGMEVIVTQCRNGTARDNSVRRITGLNKSTHVIMKRGVIDFLNLHK